MSRSEIKRKAREQLGGNIFATPWLIAILVALIASAILGVSSFIAFIFSGPITFGLSSLPEDDTAKVTVIFNYGKDDESKSVFTAQKNCYLGISGGNINASFFIDSELTVPFSPGKVFISGDLTLYAVYN